MERHTNIRESRESETQTDSQFECSKYFGKICSDKAAWKIHMIKDKLENVKKIYIHFSFNKLLHFFAFP